MALVINTNVASLNTQRQLLQSGNALDQATERLSSGNRINSAKDDAAGLAIANRMTSQIRGLDQAVRNANDGVSMIQTAEGALQEVTNILQRMRELSVQSANGIYSDDDRARLDSEAQQLKEELGRISKETTFNGQALLDGSLQDTALQVGSEQNQTIDISVGSFSTNSLGGSSGDVVGEASAGGLANLSAFTAADADTTLYVNDVALGSLADADAGATLNEKLASINADLEGKNVLASALVSTEGLSAGDGQLIAGTDTLTIAVTDGDGNAQSFVLTGTNNMEELVQKINDDTTVSASLNDNGRLVLAQENVVSIGVTGSGTAALDAAGFDGTESDGNFRLSFTDTSSDGAGVKVEGGDDAAATATMMTNLAALGLDAVDNEGNLQGAATTTQNDLEEGDLLINGVAIGKVDAGADADEQADNLIEAINKVSNLTGVVAFHGEQGTASVALGSTTGDLSVKYGDNAAATIATDTGLQERNSAAGAGSIASVDISTAAGAQKAIGIIDVAIGQVSETRADLGAVNNRLDFTVSNLTNVSEKTSAAKSRIMDADFAQETAALSKSQVLQQAATAMLAQANARPQQVLSLLQ
ncbi:flagellin N-terminal helical domain-containing protein [Gilvimarinus sp. 1_MG-2023]|uniref:flagellin N-terminal helical domain-containing protein n=1 Tax=Gilvimarinus sp. 1_MG-2023 TaxID=3062638 RepID=UPI0026E2CB74|nr:flagellin [Gilvimarinus sp. 1_MG-2023]MDO6745976.1 flagellin [Gilvimarinus sp. 1_MG-2023]